MTPLEIILSAIVWVAYGVHAYYKTTDDRTSSIVWYIIASPILFIWRCFVGAFIKEYNVWM